MTIQEIIRLFEDIAPLSLQENYDNAGLCVGNANEEATGAICCLDVTLEVLDEAIAKKANLVISHHPVVFSGLKSITGKTLVEKIVLKAIKNNIALYACHTNLDNITGGVNSKICDIIGLENCTVLSPMPNSLFKLVSFVPNEQANDVRNALFNAGAGHIGNYDSCSYNIEGFGTFRGDEQTNPFVGKPGQLHTERETRIETIVPAHKKNAVINSLLQAHPYEEVAYDLYPIKNVNNNIGAGMYGTLSKPIQGKEFLQLLKNKFEADGIRYGGNINKTITKVAVCGGSGSFLISAAKKVNADVFITGDIKFHQFFEADNNLSIIDIGHYESEQFTKNIFHELVRKKFPTFAVHLSEVNTNSIKYFK